MSNCARLSINLPTIEMSHFPIFVNGNPLNVLFSKVKYQKTILIPLLSITILLLLLLLGIGKLSGFNGS